MSATNKSIDTGYKTAFKATSLFGGVQLITILVTVLKSKVIAIFLGAAGYGIMSLFSSAIQLIYSFTNLGLASSAVRDIAQANNENEINGTNLSKTITAIIRWILATGIIGVIITVVLSPYLSRWFFSNSDHTISFIFLSLTVFFMGLNEGLYSILQGTRHLSYLAKANILGSLVGFATSVPFFIFFGDKGIIPAMIIPIILSTFVTLYFVKKTKLIIIKQTIKESFSLGSSTVKLGLMMSITAIVVTMVEFVVKSFISKQGGVADVGLYQAGWTLNASYLGLVFSAMAKDYFPRLSENTKDNSILNIKINQQAEIAMLILSPMIVFLLVFLPFLIQLIYTKEFLSIVPMTRWLLIGSLIKAGSWAISFVFLAKGDGKTFLFNELGINLITLPSYLLGYNYFGLQGIGLAYIFNYTIYFILVGIVSFNKYSFSYSKVFWKLFVISIIFTLGCISINLIFSGFYIYLAGSFVFLMTLAYSLYELNQRINISGFLYKFAKKTK